MLLLVYELLFAVVFCFSDAVLKNPGANRTYTLLTGLVLIVGMGIFKK
ncbi:MAG: hypothetical protein PHZ03_05090 [Syntrophomonas sp.]|nr:hypothetical protein [Syntrophomonas sp.]